MSDTCTLSDQDRALSTVLTAFVGSVVTGISNGPLVAFFVGWICWLAAVRITILSAIALLVTILGPQFGIQEPFLAQNEAVATASNANSSSTNNSIARIFKYYLSRPISNRRTSFSSRRASISSRRTSFSMVSERDPDVTFLGYVGWIYTFIYTPPIQIMWLASNWTSASAALKLTRAIGLGVSALTYTIDTRARYGMALGRKFGSERVVPRLMNVYSAAMNMLLSVIVVVLLIRAVSQKGNNIPIFLPPIYVVFSFIWALASWQFLRPCDGDQPSSLDPLQDKNSPVLRVLAGLLMGAFAGVFVAAPALILWQSAKFAADTSRNGNQGMSLQDWLNCQSVAWWKKAVQILP